MKNFILNYYTDGVVTMASYLESQNNIMDEIDMHALQYLRAYFRLSTG